MFKDCSNSELRVIAIATDEEDVNWTSSERAKIKSQRLVVQNRRRIVNLELLRLTFALLLFKL